MNRRILIVLPFLLLGIGAVLFYLSPWPSILHLMLTGARVQVMLRPELIGPLLGAMACWAAAIALSLTFKRTD